MDVASEIRNAVEAIDRVTRAVDGSQGGVSDAQIKRLREAIDGLEAVLNEKKRGLDADRA